MKKLFLLHFFILLSAWVYAYEAYIDGIYYNFNSSNKTATVTYKSFVNFASSGNESAYTDSITIPSIIEYHGTSYLVTRIDDEAFYQCENLLSVTIPNSIKYIGLYAFGRCKNLKSIVIPRSVTGIGEYNQEIKGETNVEIIPVSA